MDGGRERGFEAEGAVVVVRGRKLRDGGEGMMAGGGDDSGGEGHRETMPGGVSDGRRSRPAVPRYGERAGTKAAAG